MVAISEIPTAHKSALQRSVLKDTVEKQEGIAESQTRGSELCTHGREPPKPLWDWEGEKTFSGPNVTLSNPRLAPNAGYGEANARVSCPGSVVVPRMSF